MKLRINTSWIVLAVALTVGGGAAWLAQRYLQGQVAQIEARARGEHVPVVVAKEDLPKGATLSSANLAVRDVPREWAHSNAVRPEQFERIDNGKLAYPARRGEPVLWSQLEGEKMPTFSARLASGRRAVTVPVDEISSVSGLVEPGDRIDLMVTLRRESRQLAFVLMQSVQVLATGTQVEQGAPREGQPGRRSFTTITLDVSAEQARQVIAAREIGRITALLRAPGDRGAVSQSRDDAIALLGLAAPPAAAPRAGVPIIYGGMGGPMKPIPRLEGVAAAPATVAAPVAATTAATAAVGVTP